MKKCLNCNYDIKEKDVYCRNCGCLIQSDNNYIIINIMIFIIVLATIFCILLFISSFFVFR